MSIMQPTSKPEASCHTPEELKCPSVCGFGFGCWCLPSQLLEENLMSLGTELPLLLPP